jgi:hypothetical protein
MDQQRCLHLVWTLKTSCVALADLLIRKALEPKVGIEPTAYSSPMRPSSISATLTCRSTILARDLADAGPPATDVELAGSAAAETQPVATIHALLQDTAGDMEK